NADIAGHEPTVGTERGLRRGRVRIPHEQVRSAAPDLAGRPDVDVLAVVVDEPDLEAGERGPVGVDALVVRRIRPAPRDRWVLGRTEAARDLDPERRAALADRGGDRRTAETDERHQGTVTLEVEIGMVEETREEVRRALAGRQTVVEHRLQDPTGIPHVDEMYLAAAEHGNEQC